MCPIGKSMVPRTSVAITHSSPLQCVYLHCILCVHLRNVIICNLTPSLISQTPRRMDVLSSNLPPIHHGFDIKLIHQGIYITHLHTSRWHYCHHCRPPWHHMHFGCHEFYTLNTHFKIAYMSVYTLIVSKEESVPHHSTRNCTLSTGRILKYTLFPYPQYILLRVM